MIAISRNQIGEKYVPYWRACIGAGRANEGLRAAFQLHLKQVQQHIGFKYLRLHGLFHDDMFVMRKDENGRFIYNFQYVDELFDMMLENHIRPFVELSFFPACIRGGEKTQFWWKAFVTPPRQYDDWCALVEHFVRHILDRYGEEEVRQWYFEVWNEPNLRDFWDGTRSQYFELYRQTAVTIKAIDPALRVGGPATSNFVPDERFDGEEEDESKQITHRVEDLNVLQWHGVWIEAFLQYCAANQVPVDFVSTHPYPTDFALDATGTVTGRTRHVDALKEDMTWLHNIVRNSRYPRAEIHLTEWSSSPSPRDCTHDFLQEAAFIVKTNLDGVGLADSLSYWTFTDVFEEIGAGDSVFHGGFGFINYQGIVKPGFHAYRMLAALGDECLYRDENVFITKGEKGISGIAYHYPIRQSVSMSRYPDRDVARAELNMGEQKTVALKFTDLAPHQRMRFDMLDREHGWGFAAWEKMGCPEPPKREEAEALRQAALATCVWEAQADGKGELYIELPLEPWNVVHFAEI